MRFDTSLPADPPRAACFGWDGDGGFVVGRRRYRAGVVAPSRLAHALLPKVDQYPVQGRPERWARAVVRLVDAGVWAAGWTALLSLACPLWRYTRLPGATWMWSGDTGRGKTLALLAGLSVWGHPRRLLIAPGSTTKAITGAVADCGSLPAAIDEVTMMPPSAFARLVYQVSEGMDVERISRDGTQQPGGRWATMMLCTSNVSAARKINAHRYANAAQAYRVYDSRIHLLPDLDAELGVESCKAFEVNAGAAGDFWARYLTRYLPSLEGLVEEWRRELRERLAGREKIRFEPVERYWQAMVEMGWVAGRLAGHTGLLRIDMDAMLGAVLGEMAAQRTAAEGIAAHPLTLLGDLVAAYADHTLVVGRHEGPGAVRWRAFHAERMKDLRSVLLRLEATWPAGARMVAAEAGEMDLRTASRVVLHVPQRLLRVWLAERRTSMRRVEEYLDGHGALVRHGRREYSLDVGVKMWAPAVRTRCWQVDVLKVPGLALALPAHVLSVDPERRRAPIRSRRRGPRASASLPAATMRTVPDPEAACQPPSVPA